MNRLLKAYAEVDGFFDTRRAVLQWLMTEGITDDELRKREGDRLWEMHMAKNYRERRMDTFEFPGLGINRERFKEVWVKRSLEHFLMAYPTNMPTMMLSKILELEQLTDKPIDIKGVTLYINIFPYAFDDLMKEDFVAHCNSMFGGRFEIKLLNVDSREAEPNFYRQFDYVFKYDIMGEEHKAFQTNIIKQPTTGTSFVVPDILANEVDTFKGSVADRIFAYSMTVAAVLTLIPISHDFYDAAVT